MGPSIEFQSAGRYTCAPAVSSTTEIVAVEPCAPERLRELRVLHGDRLFVVIDRREVAIPKVVAGCLDGGADAYVSSGNVGVLAAHLDALVRRHRASASTR